jgi:chemotaxis protein methyltransferase CheR
MVGPGDSVVQADRAHSSAAAAHFDGMADVARTLSDRDFAAISKRIHRETGIVIGEVKRSMLVSRLARRLRALGLPDFAAYARLLELPEGEDERRMLVSAMTTNVTGFFREAHHFEALAGMAPGLLARARSGGRVRIWSAGTSTGQEAYSIAATLLDAAPELGRHDVLILATDIDPQVIDHARTGVYDRRLLGEAPPQKLLRFVQDGPQPGTVSMAPALREMIRFEVLNLLEPWPFRGTFDIIFCRNVVIYFDAETRRRLWTRFAERLPHNGILILGHSERMDPALDRLFEPVGITQYRRTGHPVG